MDALSSPFRTWNGVGAHELFEGVTIHAIGGEQVLMCRVTYAPGSVVPLHDHPEAEQLIYITGGEVTVTIGEGTRTLVAGDVAVVNRGVPHALTSPEGCSFIEALSPVPQDHIPDFERDMVLGAQGDSLHVER